MGAGRGYALGHDATFKGVDSLLEANASHCHLRYPWADGDIFDLMSLFALECCDVIDSKETPILLSLIKPYVFRWGTFELHALVLGTFRSDSRL